MDIDFRPARVDEAEGGVKIVQVMPKTPAADIGLKTNDLILPLFVRPGKGVKKEIVSMPGNYQLSVDRLVVENTGWLPSYVTKKALERKAVRPVIAEIELPPGAALETGKPREELGQLEGKAYKSAGNLGGTADPTDERAKVEWVIRAPAGAPVRVTARHERAGTVRREVVLP